MSHKSYKVKVIFLIIKIFTLFMCGCTGTSGVNIERSKTEFLLSLEVWVDVGGEILQQEPLWTNCCHMALTVNRSQHFNVIKGRNHC